MLLFCLIKRIFTIKKWILILSIMANFKTIAQQNVYTSEDEMREIFSSGGYGALFGATMGIAILPFLTGSFIENIRITAGGASIGFMLGSAYGLFNISKMQNNSYFNYMPDSDEHYYYSMPPFIPSQGYNQNKKETEKSIAKKRPLPKAGALIVGNGSEIGLAFPTFWVGKNQIGLVVTSLKF